ncbi:hypothetical protein F4813DRAFT_357404 [Daldinia decipiens]|uniref:uncharacterized protein n=1 Tax=Daldinia decipiens TaxID=326647 RepID=UPI0020C398D2|nr:uncharacterized protein F4813DRAFT_357404 [Daldinia decipiens]KAI1658114.1 hypothetical protein F4813DRAFT_357404 [Daldinia decipiens]
MANPDDYTIGWICALQEEYEVACRMLDDEFEGIDEANENDNNTYVLGRIHEHNVVIGCLPYGRYGISSAAIVAKDMIRSFPSLKFALMVGIGGGAPTPERDIRLGDVVVSVPQGRLGGVIQYDFGKRLSGGQFQQTGQMNSPPAVLLGAIPEMQRQHNDPRKPDKLAEHIKLMDDMLEYRRPNEDRLYRADYEHQGGITCEKCLADGLERRLPRVAKRAVNVHYGTIASANSVMKSAEARDQLAQDPELKVLCFEMEAAGLTNNFPCLVIRGICDYSDSHKNDEWHKYAALTAAAYARELLHVLKPTKVAVLPSWAGRLESITAELRKELSAISKKSDTVIHHQQTQEHRDILNWLTPVNYGPRQSDYLERRQPGTGKWFLDTEQFQTWRDTHGKTLFCPGIPGAGKSILTSIIIDNLESAFLDQNDVGISYVFCEFGRQHEQTADKLLASLLKQLAESLPIFPENLKSLYDKHKTKQSRPSLEEISDNIQSTAKLYSKVFVLIDAVDECQTFGGTRGKFLEKIFSLQAECGINAFATSRPMSNIMELFKDSLVLEIHAKDADVREYLKRRVEDTMSELPPPIRDDPSLQADVINIICNSARGMFLLARLHLNSLVDKISEKEVRSALKKLPNGSDVYDITYKEAMIRIEKQAAGHQDLAKRVLSWITYSKRLLTVVELQHALAIELGTTKLEKEALPHTDILLSVCAGLVTIDIQSGIIRLVHYTTKQYFDKTRDYWFPKAEAKITDACVTYLSFDVFENGSCQSDEDIQERVNSNPFFEYSALHWGEHAREASHISQAVISFLESDKKAESAGQVLVKPSLKWWPSHPDNGLHLAAWFGLDDAIRILGEKIPINKTSSDGRTALSYAVERGHEATVKVLLGIANIDVNVEPDFYHPPEPLTVAATKGNEGIVKLLLDTGKINFNSFNYLSSYSEGPLAQAIAGGHESVVELLLETGEFDVNVVRDDGLTMFGAALMEDNEYITKLLLDTKEIDINGIHMFGRTPLAMGIELNRVDIVKLLLGIKEVDVNAKSENGKTPSQIAIEYSSRDMVKLLLDTKKFDVHAPNEHGESIFEAFIWENDEEIVKLLLDNTEIDANAPDDDGNTLFDLVLISGNKGTIKLFHEYCGMDYRKGSCGLIWLLEDMDWSVQIIT